MRTDLTASLLEIFLVPHVPGEVEAQKLDFVWEAKSIDYTKGLIEIQVEFTHPLWISGGNEEDKIKVNILDMSYF